MLTSMFSAVSGLNANGTQISVIGNNIANSNTVGFKAERATFEDIMSSSLGAGASGQIGRGALVANVMPVFTQSSFDTTSNATDLAIDGRGFFVVRDAKSSRTFFTRAGNFIFNKEGLLVNPDNFIVQGWRVDENTGQPVGDIGDVDISKISSSSKPTSEVKLGVNLDSTKEAEFVINKYNNQIVYDNDASSTGDEKTIAIEEGIYTGETLAEKIQQKLNDPDLKVSYDTVTGKFTFTNNGTTQKKLFITQQNFTMSDILGFKLSSSSSDLTIDPGDYIKSTTYPKLTTKTVKITPENNTIIFEERTSSGATKYTATIPTGTYSLESYLNSSNEVTNELVDAIKTALNNADDGGGNNPDCLYNVQYNPDTGKFTIIVDQNGSSVQTVHFYWGNDTVEDDPGVDTTAESVLGFVKMTYDNQNNPAVQNSFNVDVTSGSGLLDSVYSPISIFDKSSYDYSTSINVYDSLGNPHTVTFYFKKVAQNYWEWHAVVSSNDIDGGQPDEHNQPQPYEVGNGGYLSFNPSGSLREITGTKDLYFNFSGGAKLLQNIVLDGGTPTESGGTGLDGITQFASSSTTFSQSQDGYPAGSLTGVQVDKDGVIHGIYTNGEIKPLAKLAIAKFQNPWGLAKEGKNLFAQTVSSGDAIIGTAGSGGRGQIVSNALEHSNVDIAEEFVKLIMAQRAFQANSRVVTTSDQLLLDIVSLKR